MKNIWRGAGPIKLIYALKSKALSSDDLTDDTETGLVLLNREKKEKYRTTRHVTNIRELVSKETVVLRRWGSETQNFVFIN